MPYLDKVTQDDLRLDQFAKSKRPGYTISLQFSSQDAIYLGTQPEGLEIGGKISQIGIIYELKTCELDSNVIDKICSAQKIAAGLAGSNTVVMSGGEKSFELPAIFDC